MISWLIDLILSLLGIVLFVLVLGGVLVPLESLGWWAGWGGKKQRQALLDLEKLDSEKPAAGPASNTGNGSLCPLFIRDRDRIF